MRLTDHQRKTIRDCARQTFGPAAKVRLFGSRLDDDRKGGDVDLLVEVSEPVKNAGLVAASMSAKIQMQLGERRIDVLCVWPGCPQSPVHREALQRGVEL